MTLTEQDIEDFAPSQPPIKRMRFSTVEDEHNTSQTDDVNEQEQVDQSQLEKGDHEEQLLSNDENVETDDQEDMNHQSEHENEFEPENETVQQAVQKMNTLREKLDHIQHDFLAKVESATQNFMHRLQQSMDQRTMKVQTLMNDIEELFQKNNTISNPLTQTIEEIMHS